MYRDVGSYLQSLTDEVARLRARLGELEATVSEVEAVRDFTPGLRREALEAHADELAVRETSLRERIAECEAQANAVRLLGAKGGHGTVLAVDAMQYAADCEGEKRACEAELAVVSARSHALRRAASQVKYSRDHCPKCGGQGQYTYTSRVYDAECRTTGPCTYCEP